MTSNKPLVLLVNDDGIHAPGLKALKASLSPIANLWIVAPHMERSANSHAITIHYPLFVEKLADQEYAVEGTPADCVKIAYNKILPSKPDWIVSGINRGGNLGIDTLYSGTCAAALEGALYNSKSLAVSQNGNSKSMDYTHGADLARSIILDKNFQGFCGLTLNLNVPESGPIKGIKITSLGQREAEEPILEATDPRGRSYYWLGGGNGPFYPTPGTDILEVSQGFASISILKPSLFDEASTRKLLSLIQQ
jgi:5'-nucleotidase